MRLTVGVFREMTKKLAFTEKVNFMGFQFGRMWREPSGHVMVELRKLPDYMTEEPKALSIHDIWTLMSEYEDAAEVTFVFAIEMEQLMFRQGYGLTIKLNQ